MAVIHMECSGCKHLYEHTDRTSGQTVAQRELDRKRQRTCPRCLHETGVRRRLSAMPREGRPDPIRVEVHGADYQIEARTPEATMAYDDEPVQTVHVIAPRFSFRIGQHELWVSYDGVKLLHQPEGSEDPALRVWSGSARDLVALLVREALDPSRQAEEP